MLTDNSNFQSIKQRKTGKFGDTSLFYGAHTTTFWKTLIRSWKGALVLLMRQWFKFSKAMFAFYFWGVFRFRAGLHTTGLVLTTAAVVFILGYNSSELHPALKPFSLLIVPFVPFFKSTAELFDLVFVQVESQALLIYTMIFTLSAVIHIVMIWFGGNPSVTKRGNSFIHTGLSKLMPANEFLICGIVEPLIGIGLGICAWKFLGDYYAAFFIISASLAEATQTMLDKSFQAQNQSLLNV